MVEMGNVMGKNKKKRIFFTDKIRIFKRNLPLYDLYINCHQSRYCKRKNSVFDSVVRDFVAVRLR